MLRFYYKEEVREAATTIIPALLNCCKKYSEKNNGQGVQHLHQVWQKTLNMFVDALANESELDILLTQVDCFQESINLAGPDAMKPEDLSKINNLVIQLFSDVFERRKRREDSRRDPDFDEQDERRVSKNNKKDGYVSIGLGEIIGKTFRHYGARYLPIFQNDCGDFVKRLIHQDVRSFTSLFFSLLLKSSFSFL